MTSKITLSQPTGHIRIDEGGPFVFHDPFGGIPQRVMPAKPPHHLVRPTFWSWKQCTKCCFTTESWSDIRKNNGCNMFSNYDSEIDHRFGFEDLNIEKRYLNTNEEPLKGCNIHDRSEWVKYPETGQAIQEDKFINEQVKEAIKDNARIRR